MARTFYSLKINDREDAEADSLHEKNIYSLWTKQLYKQWTIHFFQYLPRIYFRRITKRNIKDYFDYIILATNTFEKMLLMRKLTTKLANLLPYLPSVLIIIWITPNAKMSICAGPSLCDLQRGIVGV